MDKQYLMRLQSNLYRKNAIDELKEEIMDVIEELYEKASQMVAFLIGLKLGTLIGSK